LEDLCVDGRIILKWTLRKYDSKVRTGFCWIRIGTGVEGTVNTIMGIQVP
jgi:hypothetical protein